MDHARVRPDRGLHCRLVKRTLRVAGNVPLLRPCRAIATPSAHDAHEALRLGQSACKSCNHASSSQYYNCGAHKECDALSWTCTGDQSRTLSSKKLEAEQGKHLVMVRYNNDDLSVHDEWVFNGADIDGSKIVWARELDKTQNEKLFKYFNDRKVWLATTEDESLVFRPYEEAKDQ